MTCAERYAKLKAEHRCVDCKIQLSVSNKFTKCDHCRDGEMVLILEKEGNKA